MFVTGNAAASRQKRPLPVFVLSRISEDSREGVRQDVERRSALPEEEAEGEAEAESQEDLRAECHAGRGGIST